MKGPSHGRLCLYTGSSLWAMDRNVSDIVLQISSKSLSGEGLVAVCCSLEILSGSFPAEWVVDCWHLFSHPAWGCEVCSRNAWKCFLVSESGSWCCLQRRGLGFSAGNGDEKESVVRKPHYKLNWYSPPHLVASVGAHGALSLSSTWPRNLVPKRTKSEGERLILGMKRPHLCLR